MFYYNLRITNLHKLLTVTAPDVGARGLWGFGRFQGLCFPLFPFCSFTGENTLKLEPPKNTRLQNPY